MNSSTSNTQTWHVWRKIAALLLVVVALGLPINDLLRFALLAISFIFIFACGVRADAKAWLAAIAAVALVVLGKTLFPAPRIDEGHNVFVVDERGSVLRRDLPAEVFAFMQAAFNAQYPAERRCDRKTFGCWLANGYPDRAYAFSADGIYERTAYSRRVTRIDFEDAIWHRLGFVNETKYNWIGSRSDLQRESRLRGAEAFRNPWQAIFHQSKLTMPWFAVYRFPSDFAGSQLCWTGDVLWEGAAGKFAAVRHDKMQCRVIETVDTGRRIFGMAIARDLPLTMRLEPPISLRMWQLAEPLLTVLGAGAVLGFLLLRMLRPAIAPLALVGAALVVVILNDASFVGGWRVYDGGDDGLFYEGAGRSIARYLLAGDFYNALRGEENVFYYASPGMRYFRAFERFAFGDTNLGYLSLMLALPALVYSVFRRFLPVRWAIGMIVIFIAVPIGALFGSSYFLYVKWAARGFADPAAAACLLGGLLLLVGRPECGADKRFAPALGAGFLFFLALFLRPNLAPFAAVMLGGAGLAALWQAQVGRLAGLCLGFLAVVSMPLHNWVYGGEFVPFATSITETGNLATPPAVYLAAIGELASLHWSGDNLARALRQIGGWLAGPSETMLMAPIGGAAVIVLARVLMRGNVYDPWLRLIVAATLAEHAVAVFYRSFGRYYYVTWLLTLVACAVWMRAEGLDLLRRRWPGLMDWLAQQPASRALANALALCERTVVRYSDAKQHKT